jgi:hypothetical protein
MDQRFSIVTLGVTNLDRSRSFYERLGWKPSAASNSDIVFFQAGGAALALYGRAELAKDANQITESQGFSGQGFAGQGFSGLTIAYNTRSKQEVDAVMSAAEAAGAKVLKPAQEAFWGGYSGYFADPDGFAWEVAWNPFFTIADDGSLVLPQP